MHPRPTLQLALDHTRLDAALASAARLRSHVDIIEAGTLLCLSAGVAALSQLRALCGDRPLLADFKVADAGATLAEQAFSHGASAMTVICAAPLATMASAQAVAVRHGGEIQIELFGHWTLEDARAWRALGIRHAIYHRGRDAQASGQRWSDADLNAMRALSACGLTLSVTGGIEPDDLARFRTVNVSTFIVGRALTEAADPLAAARAFHDAIEHYWEK
ncbi:3-keto-L-gulonate-6-phosphate decarboxylase UlaD [Pantoea sp. 1.19]|uniref:3-keto-L-gulonate-6-phosphate decarboxylase UlaD n=1 Tax=Pantoea sp. 1.19 TaxID=1925589 RepID=UPI000948B597|nr:3-keto-L-gulonate-6-phosphate decarboxylase UlaD [Pantoea sp. 1.19]